MQWRDNGMGFAPLTLVLHWLQALVVAALLLMWLALALGAVPPGQAPDVLAARNLLGVLVFVLSAWRLWARLSSVHPLPVGTPNPIEIIVGRTNAAALLLAGVLLPVAAWLSQAAAGIAVPLPWGLYLAALPGPSPALHRVVDVLFAVGASAAAAGLALHLFGALKNHYVLRNDALWRMLGRKVEL
jgi:cytochrome b561